METTLPRRTQAERRASTRSALLDATLGALVDVGYRGTTTTEVVKRAGVSQGALFKHFPTRAALIAAAMEQLFEGLFVAFEQAFERPHDVDEARIVVALRRLWEVYTMPELLAVYRLYVEAPADPQLHAALVPVVDAHHANMTQAALGLFPELLTSDDARNLFLAAVNAMQGLALQRAVRADEANEARVLAHFEQTARLLFIARGDA